MPTKTRKQKNRKSNEALMNVKHLGQMYAQVVESIFTYSGWVLALVPDYTDKRYEEVVKWFVTQSLLYLHIFGKNDKDGKRSIYLDKEKFVEIMKNNEQIESIEYSEMFTKEMVLKMIDECLDKFFNQEMFPVVDQKESK